MKTSRLQAFGPEIWIADGPNVSFFSFPYPTRMAVVRSTIAIGLGLTLAVSPFAHVFVMCPPPLNLGRSWVRYS